MTRPFIVIGDKTSHNGTVVAGAGTVTTHGKQIARVGDQVTCPQCGDNYIASGDATLIIAGQPVARHGDKTACGATLIAGQSVTVLDEGGSGGAGIAAAISRTYPTDPRLAEAASANPHDLLTPANQAGSATPAAQQTSQQPSPPAHMQASDQAINLLKSVETLRLRPYDDATGRETSSWVPGATIGYGHLISRREWSSYQNGITAAQADGLFRADLQRIVDKVNNDLTPAVSQNQFDALVMLCYNIGPSAFASSSVLQLVNNPDAHTRYSSLDDAWRAFNRSQGMVNNGLNNRRNAELNVYNNSIYQRW